MGSKGRLLRVPLLSLLLALPAQAQIEAVVPVYPSRKRYEQDTYQKVTLALREGRQQYVIDWINADPVVCRAVLTRMLEDPGMDGTSEQLAALFPRGTISTIEEPLVHFVIGRPSRVRRKTVDAVQALNDLYLAARRTSFGDEVGRRIQTQLPSLIGGVIQVFDEVGFELGRAEALLFKATSILDLGREELPAVLEEAIDIFERHGSAAGQFLAMRRLATFHYMRAWNRDDDEHAASAEALFDRYTQVIRSSGDELLQVYLHMYLPDGRARWQDQWPKLRAMPGLPLLKAQFLLWLGESDETYLEELNRLISGVEDRVLLARLHYLTASHFHGLDDSRAFQPFLDAIAIAEEFGYDISAFDIFPGNRSRPPLAAAVSMLEDFSEALQAGLRFEEAREANRRSIDYLRRTAELWTPDQLAISRPVLLYRLCKDNRITGEYPKAIEAGTKALDDLESSGVGHLGRLVARELSGIYGDLGDFDSAEGVISRARRIPYEHFDFTSILMAETNFSFGRFDDALRWIAIAEQEKPDFVDSRISLWATVRLRLLALIWLQLGESEKALSFARALENRDPTHWMDRGVLGEVLIALGRYEEAKAYYRARIEENRDRNRKGVVRDALWNLGRLHRETGEYEQAMDTLSEGLKTARAQGYRTAEQQILEELARVEMATGQRERARSLLQESLEIAATSSDFRGIWTCHYYLGVIAEDDGDRPLAVSHYRAAVEAVEAVAGHVAVDAYQASFLQDKTSIYDRLIQLLGPTEPEEAFHYAERRRARAFLDAVQLRGFRGRKPTARSLVQRDELQAQLIGRQSALREQMSIEPGRRDQALVARLQQEILEIRRKHVEVMRSISLQHGSSAFRKDLILPIRAEAVQSRVLEPGQVLVQYVVSNQAIYAFILTSSDCRFYRLFGDRSELADDVRRLLEPFRQLREGDVDLLHVDFDVGLAHEIYQKIFEPLEPGFAGAQELLIVADDVLHFVPFEALARNARLGARDRRTRYAEFAEVDWLVRHYTISYAVSATSLDPLLDRSEPTPGMLLAFAEPLGGGTSPAPEGVFRGSREAHALFSSLAPLSRAAEEVRTVQRLMEGRLTVTTLVGAEATETAYLEHAGEAGYLHFAVHSLIDERYPEYSSLILSSSGSEDGFLQAFELAKVALNAQLVVLSACETGLGRLYQAEGLLGLKRAFLVAGARAVMVSLWNVEDAIADFVAEFYQRFDKGTSGAAALREAKLAYMRGTRDLGDGQTLSLSHPVFWAPMTLTVRSVAHKVEGSK